MASNSEGSDSVVEPHPPSLGTQVLDLNDQFEQQQSAINELKEGLQKNKQQITGKGKELEEYASKLNSIKSRSRASNRSPRPGAALGPGPVSAVPGSPGAPGTPPGPGTAEPSVTPHKDADKLTPSKSLLLLRQKVNENKLILEQRGREQTESKRGVAVMLERLKTQLEERDSTIQILQTKLSSPDATGRLHHGTGAADAARKHLHLNEQINSLQSETEEAPTSTHNGKLAELNDKVIELQAVIVGLQENLLEKDSVINARTKAIALMSEDLCRKGKTTLDQLDETKKEMRLMQNNFVQFEADMNKEKADLCDQIKARDQRLQQLEDTNNELATIRDELSARISELQTVQAKSPEVAHALAEANKQIVKLKAQTKKQLKQISNLKDTTQPNTLTDLHNKIAELEEEKGNLQLNLVDFDDIKVSEVNAQQRIAELQGQLEERNLLVDNLQLQLSAFPKVISENTQLKVQLDQMVVAQEEAELKSAQIENEFKIIRKEMKTTIDPQTNRFTGQGQGRKTSLGDFTDVEVATVGTQTICETLERDFDLVESLERFLAARGEEATPNAQGRFEANASLEQLECPTMDNAEESQTRCKVNAVTTSALGEVVLLRKSLFEALSKLDKDKRDLETKTTEIEALNSKTTAQEEKVKKLAVNLKAKNTQLNSYQVEVKELKSLIAKKERTITELKMEKETLKKDMQTSRDRSKEAAAQWDEEKKTLQNTIQSHEECDQAAIQNTREIQQSLIESKATVCKMTSQLTSLQEEIDQLRSVLQEREGYIQTLLQERESRDSEFRLSMNTIQTQNIEHRTEISRLEEKLAGCENTLTAAQQIRDKLEGQLLLSRMEGSEAQARLHQMLAAKDAKLEEQQAVLEEQSNQYMLMKEKAERVENDLYEKIECEVKLQDDYNKLHEICKQSNIFAQESENIRYSLEQQLAGADSEIQALRFQLSEQESSTDENKALVSKLEAQVLKLQKLLLVAQKKLDELIAENTRLSTVEQDLIEVSVQLVSAESELKRATEIHMHDNNLLVEELDKASGNLDSLCTRFDECDANRRELATKCDELMQEKASLGKEIEELNQAACNQDVLRNELDTKCKDLAQEIMSREQEINNLRQAASKHEDLTKELETKCEALAQEIMSREQEINSLNQGASKHEDLTKELETKCEALAQEIMSREQEINSLNQGASKHEDLTKELETKCEALAQEIMSREQEINSLNQAASKHEDLTKELDTKCEALAQEIISREQEINSLNQAVSKHEDLTKELETKCEALAQEIMSREQDINNLNQAAFEHETLRKDLVIQCEKLILEKASLDEEVNQLHRVACEQEALTKELTATLERSESDTRKRFLAEGELEEASTKEVSAAISSAPEQVLQLAEETDRLDPEWGWGTDDALLEEIHQQKTSESVSMLEAEVKKLGAQNFELAEELKNSQTLGGKLIKKIKELKSQNTALLAQIKSSSNSLDQTMEIEYSSHISSLDKDILSLKAEKDLLITENQKLSTKLEALLWQQSELKDDRTRLSAELEWTNKTIAEKDKRLCEVEQINAMKVDTADKTTITDDEEVKPPTPEEIDGSSDHCSRSATRDNSGEMCRHHEDLKHDLEAREKEIVALKERSTLANERLEAFTELTIANQSLQVDLTARVQENHKLSQVLLDQEKSLFESNSRYLARDREAATLETELQMKNSEIEALSQELKEHLNVIHLLKAVQNNGHELEQDSVPAPTAGPIERRREREGDNKELDHALYRLHQKEVRCDELTIELMQLLEERDTLQLRLSVSLRNNEELKKTLHPLTASAENRACGESVLEASAPTEPEQGVLANKLDQLRSVGREQRHMALQQQQRGDVALDANYTPRDQEPEIEPEQESFFQWIWGRGTPKVMDV